MARHDYLTGVRRVLNSAKVQFTAVGGAAAYVAARFAAPTIPPDQRAWLWLGFLGALAVMVREVVNAWAAEDVAAKSQAAPPAVQVNTGSDAANVQQATPPPSPPTAGNAGTGG
jgi:hypothetical protein